MNKWIKGENTIAGYKVARYKDNMNKGFGPAEYEETISGYYGEIWRNGTSYKVVVTSANIANKIARLVNKSPNNKIGDEAVYSFEENLLLEVVKLLKLPKSHATRVRLANNFGKKR